MKRKPPPPVPFGLRENVWLFLLATGAVLYPGWPFFSAAIRSLRRGVLDMAVLVLLSVGTGYGFSIASTFFIDGPNFYEASAVLLTFVLLGHWLEMRARAEPAIAEDGVGVGRNDESLVVKACRQALACNLGRIAVVSPMRHAADQAALEQALGVEDGVVTRRADAAAKGRDLLPGLCAAEALAPAADGDRNHLSDVWMQARNLGERLLDAPVDRRLGKSAAQVADDRQVVDDIAE